MEVAKLQRGLALELLDEVAVPVEPADEGGEAVALGAGGQVGDGVPRGMDDLAQAEAAEGDVGRQARAGGGGGKRRRDAAPVLPAALGEEVVQHREAGCAAAGLATGWIVITKAQGGGVGRRDVGPGQWGEA